MRLLLLALGGWLLLRQRRVGQPATQVVPSVSPVSVLPSVYLDARRVMMVNRFDAIISEAAKQLRLDPNILRAMVYLQSGGNERARIMQPDSEYGYGLTQITCSRARRLPSGGTTLTIDPVTSPTDCDKVLEKPENSIWYGASYLRALHTGSWEMTLARYYSPSDALAPNPRALEKARVTLAIAKVFESQSS